MTAASQAGRPGAFFDVDGTLTRSDIFRDLVTFRRAMHHDPIWHATWPLRGIFLLGLDRISRLAVNRVTYSWYRGVPRELLDGWAQSFQRERGLERFRPRGLDVLRTHARLGHRIVFVTGALDAIVRPLPAILAEHAGVPAFADIRIEAVHLVERDGVFTGALDGPPLGEEEKRSRVLAVAAEEGLDLASSFADGDSIADLPMLRAVSRPAAVSPDRRLQRLARAEGWPVLDLDDDVRKAPRSSP